MVSDKSLSRNSHKYLKVLILILLPFVLFFLLYLFSDKIIGISDNFGKCVILEKYGILCPGCGNTRCVKEMLKGHFIKAFSYNITIPLFTALFLFYYICYIFKTAGKELPQIVDRRKVIVFLLILLVIYYFARNIHI